MKKKYGLCVLFLFFLLGACFSQMGSAQEEAMQLYSEGNYSEALIRFKKLMTLFPKDPKYFYYSGVCMVQTNTSIENATKNLLYASQYAVPRDVYFFLGRAYHNQYKFSEAIDAYQKFKHFGILSDQEKLQSDMYMAMAHNGQNIYHYVKIKILDKKSIELSKIYSFCNEELKNGQFKRKPEKLISLKDGADDKSWRYEPYLIEKDVIVYGSNQGLLKHNRDIYQTKKLNGKQWSHPDYLNNTINTSFDEDYAYFNEAESALYFSSKGHNSMGGYDIFKSIYNPDYKTWSDPINLGYPINSPYNDYLFIPCDDQKSVWFASDRETSDDKVMLYKIAFEKKYATTNLSTGFVFKNTLSVDSVLKTVGKLPPPAKPKSSVTPKTAEPPPIKNIYSYHEPAMESNNYDKIVNGALVYQLKSDSTYKIINEQRDLLNNTEKESSRATIKTRIFQLDKQAKKYQSIADSLYVKARDYETHTASNDKQDQMTVTDEMVKKALKKGDKGKPKETTAKKNENSIKQKEPPVLYEFKVMEKSPYKSTSDILVNQPLPDGIVYRVQMGAFSKTIEPDRFKGIIPINGETIQNTSVIKYYAGLFGRFSDAEKALNKIKEYGFKDAFIVSYYNKKAVPTNRAVELEKDISFQ